MAVYKVIATMIPLHVVCKQGPKPDKVLVKCDGDHEFETGFHIECLPKVQNSLGELVAPQIDTSQEWLCPQCVQQGLWIHKAVKNKRRYKSKVQYLIECVRPGESKDEWMYHSHLSKFPAINAMIREYNKQHK